MCSVLGALGGITHRWQALDVRWYAVGEQAQVLSTECTREKLLLLLPEFKV